MTSSFDGGDDIGVRCGGSQEVSWFSCSWLHGCLDGDALSGSVYVFMHSAHSSRGRHQRAKSEGEERLFNDIVMNPEEDGIN